MNNHSTALVQKLWNYCNILRDDGLSYGDYVEQLTFLLFLKMADENILHKILERWHESKKRFLPERWRKAIGWMKENGFVPTGFGKPTRKPE
jgi:type I restriction-modification system DNA methylase subunit